MLQQISWNEFIEGSIGLAGVYYLGVIVYYRRGIVASIRERRGILWLRQKAPIKAISDTDKQDTAVLHFILTEKIAVELKQVIAKVTVDKVELPDVLASIGTVLRQHPELQNTPYGRALNKFIIRECKSNNTILLDAKDLEKLWNG